MRGDTTHSTAKAKTSPIAIKIVAARAVSTGFTGLFDSKKPSNIKLQSVEILACAVNKRAAIAPAIAGVGR
jgi:hypothetical protein